MIKNIKIAGITTLLLTLTAVSCTKEVEENSTSDYTPVKTDIVNNGEVKETITFTSTIQPNATANIVSPLVAEVTSTNYEVGDTISEGDTLFTLDNESMQNQVNSLEQQVKIAELSLEQAKLAQSGVTGSTYQNSVSQLETGITATQDQLTQAKSGLSDAQLAVDTTAQYVTTTTEAYNSAVESEAQAKEDYNNGIITEVEYLEALALKQNTFDAMNEAKLASTQAQASVEQAEAGVKTLENSLASQQDIYNTTTTTMVNENNARASLGVQQAEVALETAQMAYDAGVKSLDQANITSPISGVVSQKGVEEGHYATNQSIAYQVIDKSSVYTDVRVSEKIVPHLIPGSAVEVVIPSISNQPVLGKIETVAPSSDQTKTYNVRVRLNDTSIIIFPGMFCEVTFTLNQSTGNVVIPTDYILSTQEGYFVYVVDNTNSENPVVEKREVTLGLTNGETVEVLSGLNNGETIVSEGQSYVSDNETVRIVSDQPTTEESESNTENTSSNKNNTSN